MKQLTLILKLTVGVVVSVFLWICIVGLFYGQSKVFWLDENYALVGWPGMLSQYNKELKVYAPLRGLPSNLNKYGVNDTYIVVGSDSGWIVIDRNQKKILYENINYDSLKEKFKQIETIKIKTNFPWLRINHKWFPISSFIFICIVVFVFIFRIRVSNKIPRHNE